MSTRSDFGWISLLKNSMMALNTIAVMFYAGIQLAAVKYIIDTGQSTSFVRDLHHIPKNPDIVFFGCLLGLIVLGAMMMIRSVSYIEDKKKNIGGAIIETAAAFVISALLNFAFPSIFLMIFCDCIFHFRRQRTGRWMLFIPIALYFFLNYRMVNLFIPLMDTSRFFEVFPEAISATLTIVSTLFGALGIVLAVMFIGVFLSWQIQENEEISQELSMVSEVNRELKNYAAITEKIGEDKERKRLAREIHDTLGHALTGIAAGVDACLVILDKNPDAAKVQLQLVSKVVRQGINDVRASLKKLRPGALEAQGLKGALQNMIQEFNAVSDLKITLAYNADEADFDVAKENVLFRLIQESITNSTRHGNATEIGIYMGVEDDHLVVDIHDNGSGCEEIHYGYGLRQMQERVLTVSGSVEFDGSNGFSTHVKIPLKKGEKTV